MTEKPTTGYTPESEISVLKHTTSTNRSSPRHNQTCQSALTMTPKTNMATSDVSLVNTPVPATPKKCSFGGIVEHSIPHFKDSEDFYLIEAPTPIKPTPMKSILHKSPSKVDAPTPVKPTPKKHSVRRRNATKVGKVDTTGTYDPPLANGFLRMLVLSPEGETSPHEGLSRVLEPKPKTVKAGACTFGRSKAQSYRDSGASLSLDEYISVYHGKVFRTDDQCGIQYFYQDFASCTNKTIDVETGKELEEGQPHKLENGTQLLVGTSILRFTFAV